MPEIEKIYGDTVPMWKTEAELIELIKYYLSPEHEAERKDKARRAREITLKHFTAEIAAKRFNDIITPLKQQKGLQ
jgi:spore maturation protein CgeB